MLKAHGEYILPKNVPANEFLNLEGKRYQPPKIGQYGFMNI